MTTANRGLILREDASLKAHLQGMTVLDATSGDAGRPVKVYYRLPEQEAKRREYPYVTIDLLNIARDASREHRGYYRFRTGEEYHPPTRVHADPSRTEWPVPLLFTYQVTSFARFIQHDRQILAQMLTEKLPERFGAVSVVASDENTDDHSIRRLDIISGPQSGDQTDSGDPNKRIFRKIWTVQMSSEWFPSEIVQAAAPASNVNIDIFEFLHLIPHIVGLRGEGSLVATGF